MLLSDPSLDVLRDFNCLQSGQKSKWFSAAAGIIGHGEGPGDFSHNCTHRAMTRRCIIVNFAQKRQFSVKGERRIRAVNALHGTKVYRPQHNSTLRVRWCCVSPKLLQHGYPTYRKGEILLGNGNPHRTRR